MSEEDCAKLAGISNSVLCSTMGNWPEANTFSMNTPRVPLAGEKDASKDSQIAMGSTPQSDIYASTEWSPLMRLEHQCQ